MGDHARDLLAKVRIYREPITGHDACVATCRTTWITGQALVPELG
jgi:hypothetical protein